MPERKPKKRLTHTTRSSVTLHLDDLQPGARLSLRVLASRRRTDRKRRSKRNLVIIERSADVALRIGDVETP